MTATTPNYGLIKPDQNEFYNVDVFNENSNIVDATLGELRAQIKALTGLDISGITERYGNLPNPADFPAGILFLVRTDETHTGQTSVYKVTNQGGVNVWVYQSEFGAIDGIARAAAAVAQSTADGKADTNITLADNSASTVLPAIASGSIKSKVQSVRDNLKALSSYFTNGVANVANGGTGVKSVAEMQNLMNDSDKNSIRMLRDVVRYQGSANPTTGAIILDFPYGTANNAAVMYSIRIIGFVYGMPWELFVSGYTMATGWTLPGARSPTGGVPGSRVRFGNSASSFAVIIGDVGTAWAYPAVSVQEMQMSWSGRITPPASGFTLRLATDLSAYTMAGDFNPNVRPIADGGTGATTAALARAALDLGASTTGALPITIDQGGTGATTAALARAALGLGVATTGALPIQISQGGTGATTAALARNAIGLGTAGTGALPITVAQGGTGSTNGTLGVTPTVTDCNTATNSGLYYGYQTANAPDQGGITLLVIRYSADWIMQVCYGLAATPGVPVIWYRTRHSGTTWGAWLKQPVISIQSTAPGIASVGDLWGW